MALYNKVLAHHVVDGDGMINDVGCCTTPNWRLSRCGLGLGTAYRSPRTLTFVWSLGVLTALPLLVTPVLVCYRIGMNAVLG